MLTIHFVLASHFMMHMLFLVLDGILLVEYFTRYHKQQTAKSPAEAETHRHNKRRLLTLMGIAGVMTVGLLLEFFFGGEDTAMFRLGIRTPLIVVIAVLVYRLARQMATDATIRRLGNALVVVLGFFILTDFVLAFVSESSRPTAAFAQAVVRMITVGLFYYFAMLLLIRMDRPKPGAKHSANRNGEHTHAAV